MIELKQVSKNYDKICALKNVSLTLSMGEIIFLVGPNGAGKSTLLRLISGYLTPTSGIIEVAGHNMRLDVRAALAHMGYVPENCPLYPEMTVFEYIRYAAALRQMEDHEFYASLKNVIKNLQLEEVMTQRIDTLSKGFRRRVGIAGALIHNPDILILDEPTEGLDPNQKNQLHQLIKAFGKERLIIISTHLMEEVEAVATRVAVINKGSLIWEGSPRHLGEMAPDGRIETSFRLLTGEG